MQYRDCKQFQLQKQLFLHFSSPRQAWTAGHKTTLLEVLLQEGYYYICKVLHSAGYL